MDELIRIDNRKEFDEMFPTTYGVLYVAKNGMILRNNISFRFPMFLKVVPNDPDTATIFGYYAYEKISKQKVKEEYERYQKKASLYHDVLYRTEEGET